MNKINIVIVIVDCLRKDYALQIEKKLEKRGFTIYDNVYASAPWTIPSVTSILTGLYPSSHGVHESKNAKLPKIKIPKNIQQMMIQKVLASMGFKTFLLSANYLVSSAFGFVGFNSEFVIDYIRPNPIVFLNNIYKIILRSLRKVTTPYIKQDTYHKFFSLKSKDDISRLTLSIRQLLNNKYDKGSRILLDKAVKLLLTPDDKQKFIYIHLMEPHEPYPNINQKELNVWAYINAFTGILNIEIAKKLKAEYEKESILVSNRLVDFVEKLEKYGLMENTLFIITGDHGQMLGEKKLIGHGIYLHKELLKVPLLIHYPSDIEIQNNSHVSVVSLTNLYDLILSIVTKKSVDNTILYSDTAFAESWGLQSDLHSNYKSIGISDDIYSKCRRFSIVDLHEKHRIYIQTLRGSAIFNVSDNKLEYYEGNVNIERIYKLIRRFKRKSLASKITLIHGRKI